MFRTGTASMSKAYEMLGLRAHHGHDMIDDAPQWALWEQAAEATWPDVPGAPRQRRAPWTRHDWDRILGPYDVVTDMGCLFVEDLVRLYPEARVVVVERDVDAWEPSFAAGVVDAMFGPLSTVMRYGVMPVLGVRTVAAMRKMLLGGFGVRDGAALRARARAGYAEYYRRVREVVPAERRLEYRLGDGWESLCAFLGKPVPDAPFPRVNEVAQHNAKRNAYFVRIANQAFWAASPWVLGAVVVGVAAFTRASFNK